MFPFRATLLHAWQSILLLAPFYLCPGTEANLTEHIKLATIPWKKMEVKQRHVACFYCLKQEKGIWSKNRPFVKAYFLEVVRKRLLNWIVFICSKKCMINVDVDLHWGVLTRKYNKQLFYRKAFSIKNYLW